MVKLVHYFLNRSVEIPPMYIENVDVMCPKLLETGFNTDLQGLCVVSGVVSLDFNVVVSTLKIRRILKRIENTFDPTILRITFVAITNWSRIPRDSAHSPINASEVSS